MNDSDFPAGKPATPAASRKISRRRKQTSDTTTPAALLGECRTLIRRMLHQIEQELDFPNWDDTAKPKGRKSPPEVLEILVTLLLKLHQEEGSSAPCDNAPIDAGDLALIERYLVREKERAR